MDDEVLSGRVLGGRYTLGERLGQGGWGSVYAAVQADLGRAVAVKVLHTNVALTLDGVARFEREAKAAAALGHPNIAQVTDFQANPGEPAFLVMELLTGRTLGATLKQQHKLPVARVAWIAYQILAGLDVAHRAGIVHRDRLRLRRRFFDGLVGSLRTLLEGAPRLAFDGGRCDGAFSAVGFRCLRCATASSSATRALSRASSVMS